MLRQTVQRDDEEHRTFFSFLVMTEGLPRETQVPQAYNAALLKNHVAPEIKLGAS